MAARQQGIFFSILLVFFTLTPTQAETEISGVVLDRTMTHYGHDFFRKFSLQWLDQQLAAQTALIISETPSARSGHRIRILKAEHVLYQTTLQRGRTISQQSIKQAVATTANKLFRLLTYPQSSADLAHNGF